MLNSVLVVKAGKQQLQQVFANLPDGTFRRRVVRILVVEAAHPFARSRAALAHEDSTPCPSKRSDTKAEMTSVKVVYLRGHESCSDHEP